MMATMTTVATGDDDNSATDDGAMGYEDDDDGNGQRQRWRQATMAMAMVDDKTSMATVQQATKSEMMAIAQ